MADSESDNEDFYDAEENIASSPKQSAAEPEHDEHNVTLLTEEADVAGNARRTSGPAAAQAPTEASTTAAPSAVASSADVSVATASTARVPPPRPRPPPPTASAVAAAASAPSNPTHEQPALAHAPVDSAVKAPPRRPPPPKQGSLSSSTGTAPPNAHAHASAPTATVHADGGASAPVAPPRRKKKADDFVESPAHSKSDEAQASVGDGKGEQVKIADSETESAMFVSDMIRKMGPDAAKGSSPQATPVVFDRDTPLTDEEILSQVMIKNLDTGEYIPLSEAEKRLPKGLDPLALCIFRRTVDIDGEMDEGDGEDEDGPSHEKPELHADPAKGSEKTGMKGLKKGFKFLKDKVKDLVDDHHQDVHAEEGYLKTSVNNKSQVEFGHVRPVQDLTGAHVGAVWTMKFSCCGRLLATAGQDAVVRVWVAQSATPFFEELRHKFTGDSENGEDEPMSRRTSRAASGAPQPEFAVFEPFPYRLYVGHTADVLDLSWSKNYFLLTSSMDKTVRLWHVARQECLCCFQHSDFVTAIAFHPRDDRYFLSGSLDSKLRLWNIPEKKVALWNEIVGSGANLITAANFCQNGKMAVVGTYDGRCVFFDTERLKYHTQIEVRSTRGKNAKGRKISGIEPMPGENKILVTSNDSRVRLYDLKDHSLSCKYRGFVNTKSQIKAGFSNNGKYIISGSEDHCVYLWGTYFDPMVQKRHDRMTERFTGYRRDRNDSYEAFSVGEASVTAAVFAPYSTLAIKGLDDDAEGEVVVIADFHGAVKVFVNKSKDPQIA
eukprot:Opistho-2@4098